MLSNLLLASAGGALIGLAAVFLLWMNGRILGVSGIFYGLLHPNQADKAWRIFFLVGLFAGGWIPFFLFGLPLATAPLRGPFGLLGAGFLVGLGVVLGSGCTSGHGVCGVGRLAPRSLLATATFMIVGMLVVFCLRHVRLFL